MPQAESHNPPQARLGNPAHNAKDQTHTIALITQTLHAATQTLTDATQTPAITQHLALRAHLAETHIRDLIRAPHLATLTITHASATLRSQGIDVTLLDDWSSPYYESDDASIGLLASSEVRMPPPAVEVAEVVEEIAHLMRTLEHNSTNPAHPRATITVASQLRALPHPTQLQHLTVRLWPAGKRYVATFLCDTCDGRDLRVHWPNQPAD